MKCTARTRTETPTYQGTPCTLAQSFVESNHSRDFVWEDDYADGFSRYLTRTTDDVVVENFRKLQAAGVVINNPYKNITQTWEMKPSLVSARYYNYETANPGVWFDGKLNGYHPVYALKDLALAHTIDTDELTDFNVDQMVDLAVAKAWASVSNSQFQLLVTVAEARKTFTQLVKLFRRVLAACQRGQKLKRRLSTLGLTGAKAASTWLEYRYGLRPLYFDIRNCIQAINTLGGAPRTRFSAYVSDTKSNAQYTGTYNIPCNDDSWIMSYSGSCNTSIEVSAGVLVQANKPKITVPQALGTDDFLQSCWELVPYSFVVDWFVNIGDLIAAWEPAGDVTPLTSWAVIRELLTFEYHPTTIDQRWYNISNVTSTTPSRFVFGGSCIRQVAKTQRIVTPDRPVIPSLNINLDVTRFIDLVALLTQALRQYGT